jgi:hypothetical protein
MASIKKLNFILKCKEIDIEKIHEKYGISLNQNIKTNIEDIIYSEPDYSLSFYDEKKIEYKAQATMIDYITKNEFPLKTHVKCFWCRNNFDTHPIGCPIKFINSLIEKQYTSNITKDEYYMKENVTKTKISKINNSDLSIQIEVSEKNYYLVDGIFCSFNCVLAFIKENNTNVLYKESLYLLKCLYNSLYQENIKKLTPAPHWRLLKDFGGNLTIEEFRSFFNSNGFTKVFTAHDFSCMKLITHIYKENSC